MRPAAQPGRAIDPKVAGGVDEDDPIAEVVPAGLQQDRGIKHDGSGLRAAGLLLTLDCCQKPGAHQRMQDRLQGAPRHRIGKNGAGQRFAVDLRPGLVRDTRSGEHAGTEPLDDLAAHPVCFEQVVPDPVGIDHGRAALGQNARRPRSFRCRYRPSIRSRESARASRARSSRRSNWFEWGHRRGAPQHRRQAGGSRGRDFRSIVLGQASSSRDRAGRDPSKRRYKQ